MKKLLALLLSICLTVSCFALLGVSQNYTPKVSIEEFSAELSEMNRKYKDEPVGNRLIVKSKRDIAALDSVDIVEGYKDLHIVQFDDSESAEEALEYYNDSKLIEYAEQDFTMSTCEIDYKPHLSWGSESMGTDDYISYLEDIDDLPEIVVGVIDTGIEFDHEFLRDRIIQTGVNFSDSGEIDSENDDNGHGTHCAGIIVDNTLDNVKIEGYKVLSSQGVGNTTGIISGIYSAIENNVNIISMSLGGFGSSRAMQSAVDLAISKNITVCAAAGNSGMPAAAFCPANLNGVITVGAHDCYDKIPTFSNYGDAVDIIAPGVSVYSSYIGNTYKTLTGTSMACPHVAAACALLLSKNISSSPSELLNTILASGRDFEIIPDREEDRDKIALYIGVIHDDISRTAPPEFAPEPQVYEDYVDVELFCKDENAQIYYTIDGSLPRIGQSDLYNSPIHITKPTIIRAIAFCEGKLRSKTVTEEYNVISEEDESLFEIDNNGIITAYNGNNLWMKIPDTIDNKTVKGIGDRVFLNSNVHYLAYPDTVTTLGSLSFSGCNNLISIDLKNVERIGDYCFSQCHQLESVVINKDIIVEERAFYDCFSLNNIDLTKIKNNTLFEETFYNCASITEFVNDRVMCIEDSAFDGCESLVYVDAPNLKGIGNSAFFINYALETFKAPSLESMGGYALSECHNLKEINLPNLKQITEGNNFSGCINVNKIDVHNIESDIPDGAFADMSELNDISLDKPVNVGIAAFTRCTKLRTIKLKNAVNIGERAFENCSELKIAYLPNVNTINKNVFNKSLNLKLLFAPKLQTLYEIPLSNQNASIYTSNDFIRVNKQSISNNYSFIAPQNSFAEELANENGAIFIDSESIVDYIGSYQAKGKRHYDFCLDGIGDILSFADNVECSFICDGEELEAEAGNRNGERLYLSFSSSENISSLRAKINIDSMVFMSPELTEFDNVKAVDVLPDNDCGHNWELIYFADGISVFNCAECNESYYVSFISQLRHNDNLIDMNSDGKVNGKDYHYLMRDYSAYSVSV